MGQAVELEVRVEVRREKFRNLADPSAAPNNGTAGRTARMRGEAGRGQNEKLFLGLGGKGLRAFSSFLIASGIRHYLLSCGPRSKDNVEATIMHEDVPRHND